MERFFKFLLPFAAFVGVTSCFSVRSFSSAPKIVNINLENTTVPDNHYNDLTKGLIVEVSSSVSDSQILDCSNLNSKETATVNAYSINVDPSIKSFVSNSLTTYARSLGINVGRDVENDLILQVSIKSFRCVFETLESGRAVVELEYNLMNSDRESILRQVARGRSTWTGAFNKSTIYTTMFDSAMGKALNDIDWDGIANNLKINKRADQEQQRMVKGEGDTALEHTVVMWRVVSTPAGADVYWRIVSSTPDVKNTNSTYLGTTPYEATETFNVRGLTFENTGNVQVEIVCEKPGYLTQSKRFNLRQAIEQREISTKFNLIKDE